MVLNQRGSRSNHPPPWICLRHITGVHQNGCSKRWSWKKMTVRYLSLEHPSATTTATDLLIQMSLVTWELHIKRLWWCISSDSVKNSFHTANTHCCSSPPNTGSKNGGGLMWRVQKWAFRGFSCLTNFLVFWKLPPFPSPRAKEFLLWCLMRGNWDLCRIGRKVVFTKCNFHKKNMSAGCSRLIQKRNRWKKILGFRQIGNEVCRLTHESFLWFPQYFNGFMVTIQQHQCWYGWAFSESLVPVMMSINTTWPHLNPIHTPQVQLG